MSYAIEWVTDARDNWRALDIATQEDVLDELDRITETNASDVRPSGVVDFIAGHPANRVVVFLQLAVNHE